MKKLLPLVAVAAVTLVGCNPPPTGPSLAPGGQTVPSSGRILSGTVQGAKVGANTKVGLYGSYTLGQGGKVDALGKPISGTDALIVSVVVKDGKYALDIPQPPTGAASAGFKVMVYNDTNNNATMDPTEEQTQGNSSMIGWFPIAGYQLLNTGAAQITDVLAFDKVNVLFN